MSLKLSIVTPLKKLITDLDVKSVTLPAFEGELTILDHHEPLVSTLETGILSYIDSNTLKAVNMVISWGYVEINNGVISVLAETVETLKDLDFERAKKSLKDAEQALKLTDDLEVISRFQNKVKKAESRLKLS